MRSPPAESTSDTIEIREDVAGRNTLAVAIARAGRNAFRRWALASAGLTAAVALALHALGIPDRLWPGILLMPAFPLLVSGILIVAPLPLLLPQRWTLTADGVRGRGFRALGSVSWADIREWSIDPMADLPGHYVVRFRWSSKHGIAGASVIIYVPPSVDIACVERSFTDMIDAPSAPSGRGS